MSIPASLGVALNGLKKKKKKRKIGLGEFGFENIKCFPILKNGRNLVTNVENCFKIFEIKACFLEVFHIFFFLCLSFVPLFV